MELIKKSSEDEMISVFLNAEVSSNRFGKRLKEILYELKVDKEIIINPDIQNDDENEKRKKIIAKYRGYGANKELFEDFPKIERWEWIKISKDELKKVKYINYDYWIELTEGTRLPVDAVRNINKGIKIYNQSNEGYIKAGSALKNGKSFKPMILVKAVDAKDIVVLEGHLRLTAYMMEEDSTPDYLEVVIGYSTEEKLKKWALY